MGCEFFFLGNITSLVITTTSLIFRFFETKNDLKDAQRIEMENK